MRSKQTLTILKVVMVLGLILFLFGHYLLAYSTLPETMGITGIIISAGFMAVGVVLSLPTKMYLTFIWVTAERDKKRLDKNKTNDSDR